MKHKLLTTALLLASFTLWGQNKMDINVSLMVENYKAQLLDQDMRPSLKTLANEESEQVAVLVALAPGTDEASITDNGVQVVERIGDMAVVKMPVSKIEAFAENDDVLRISCQTYQPLLYSARNVTQANPVLDGTGEGLGHAFTGKGVITGLFDSGIDVNHVNFYNADQTENRFKAFFNYSAAGCTEYLTPEDIASFTTDNRSGTHGTHVLGIMSGGYRGNGDFGLNAKAYTNEPIPFYGLARDAEIIGAGGPFTDANLAAGARKMVEYAKAQGKPCVINYSIGGLIGPHDGSSSISKAFEELGEDAIIVVAAGNDAGRKCAVKNAFNQRKTNFCTAINAKSDVMQFWNSTDNPFKFELVIYNAVENKITASYELTGTSVRTITASTAEIGPILAQASTSKVKIQMQGFVDKVSNRYQVSMIVDLPKDGNTLSYLTVGVRITGKAGETATGFIQSGEFTNNSITGWIDGTDNGSISDMSTGKNIICVGSFTSSKSWPTISGGMGSLTETNGRISSFSSYGVTNDGRGLPDLVAPGCVIVSSFNSFAAAGNSAKTTFNGKTYTWGNSQGTSMACPYVAGTVALMLEANPALKVNEVREILTSTCTAAPSDANSTEKIQYGAGKINVYAAVKKALESASVDQIWSDDEVRLIITPTDGGYEIFVAGERCVKATLFDLSGRPVASAAAAADQVVLPTTSVTPGIYVVNVEGSNSRYSKKLSVR